VGGFDGLYISNPDLQLNDWPNDQNATSPHYGASFLYLTYFLDRFGEDATKAVVKDPANGFDGIDDVLKQLAVTDPVTKQPISADDVFIDWAVTNYVLDGKVGDGRYIYHNYSAASSPSATETISDCPQAPLPREVHQYGVDYIQITCQGDHTLHFEGSTATGLLPVNADSGKYAFWSNKGDESDMTLTHEFDLTNVSGSINLTYHTWYDLEKDYDYLYLEASTDGEHWQILTTPSGTADNPSGNSYGWGYNGKSNDWIEESVDLSQFAGKKVQLRFEYVTDAAVNGEGLLLDDVKIDAINYQSDFETDDGGWQAKGFVRVENVLPQTYRLALITKGDTTTVTQISLNPDQTADIPLSLKSGEDATLVVTGTTRFTRLPAAYQVEIK
jgi:immune inhibitor A